MNHASQLPAVAQHIGVCDLRAIHIEADVFGMHLDQEQVLHFSEQLDQIGGGWIKCNFTAFDTAHLEDIIQKHEQLPPRNVNLFDVVVNSWRYVAFLAGQVRITDNGIHRRPDVMGHVEQELAFCPVALLDTNHVALEVLLTPAQSSLDIEHDRKAYTHKSHEHDGTPQHQCAHFPSAHCAHQALYVPHEHAVEQQAEQDSSRERPRDNRGQLTLVGCPPIEQKAQKTPDRKKQERRSAHGLDVTDARHELNGHERDGNHHADNARLRNRSVALSARDLGS